MAWLDGGTVAIVQVCLVGGIILGAGVYRVHVWRNRRQTFDRSLTASAFVFVAFGLGVGLMGLTGRGPAGWSVSVPHQALIAGPPLAVLAFRFWRGESASPFQAAFIFTLLGWFFLFVFVQDAGAGTLPYKLVIVGGLVGLCFVLGIVNGALGPLVPALILAHGLAGVMDGSASLLDLPFGIAGDLVAEVLPRGLRLLAGVAVVVLGLAEFFSFFGIKVILDRAYDLVR